MHTSKKLNLSEKIFDSAVPQEPVRKGFGQGLLEAAEADERVVGLCADLTESTQMHLFARKFPQRFVEMGIGEQSMASVASGMAAMGKIPFLTSYAMFSPGRNWEQIRTTICYNNRNVKIAGSHAGVSVGPDGGTHQAIEDIAITRVIPRMTVIVPCDSVQAKKATLAAARMDGPCYIRLAREKTPLMTTEETEFEIGKAQLFREGKDVTIVASGPLIYNALIAADELEKDGVSVRVINLHTVKPIDEEALVSAARETGAFVTVEEHQAHGGMGSAVCEVLAGAHPVPVEIIGVQDRFGESGEPNELIKYFGMGIQSIKEAVKRVVKRKNV